MTPSAEALDRNVRLCPWFRACSDLMFWQAVWFLSFQSRLSASEAILLYAVYEASTTALEAPSGWMSDRLGRRATLIAGAAAAAAGAFLLAGAGGFAAAWAGMALLGAGAAFASGADSAFLYESLAARGRRDETERWELRVWRFGFAALAVSAVLGAALARAAPAAPFAATGAAFCAALVIAWRFVEPPRTDGGAGAARIGETLALLRRPALAWLFALGLLSYAFGHVMFVFGQPFIAAALAGSGLSAEAPLVSGVVAAGMMGVSLLASWPAPWLRARLGLTGLLLGAFAMQVTLIGAFAATGAAAAIALLLLRQAPSAWVRPFLLAAMQPLIGDASRATLLSLQSLCGRLLLAGSLWAASAAASAEGEMARSELTGVLGVFAALGALCVAALAVTARRIARDAAAAEG